MPCEVLRSGSARASSSAATVSASPFARTRHRKSVSPVAVFPVAPWRAFTSAPALASTGTSAACPFSAASPSAVHRSRALRALTSAP
eukprot:6660846-Prymnesium_polylepis.1